MLKILLITTVAFVASLVIWSAPASAHVLQTDGQIGAVFHINPDDDPVSGQSSEYIMSFEDTSGRFSLSDCDCNVIISTAGNTVDTKPLAISSTTTSINRYTFVSPAVYTMQFRGQPKLGAADFQPFSLNFVVRVSGGKAKARPTPLLLWAGLAMMMGLILLAAYATNSGYNY